MAPRPVELHLVVLQHGLWGCQEDMAFVQRQLKLCTDPRKVIILNSGVNSGRLTYDGIDVLGDRLACLVRSFCARLATGGLRRVTRISFVAYSLGGLIARYAIGKLAGTGFFSPGPGSRQGSTAGHTGAGPEDWGPLSPGPLSPGPPEAGQRARTSSSGGSASSRGSRGSFRSLSGGDYCGVQPVNFVTFASPHLGCWSRPDSLYRRLFNLVLPWTLSRTGCQLVYRDHFLDGLPLLAVMAHPEYAFHAGLSLFQKRVALANVHHDATVPFSTAAMEPDCPYHDLACEPISDRYPCIIRPVPPSRPSSSAGGMSPRPEQSGPAVPDAAPTTCGTGPGAASASPASQWPSHAGPAAGTGPSSLSSSLGAWFTQGQGGSWGIRSTLTAVASRALSASPISWAQGLSALGFLGSRPATMALSGSQAAAPPSPSGRRQRPQQQQAEPHAPAALIIPASSPRRAGASRGYGGPETPGCARSIQAHSKGGSPDGSSFPAGSSSLPRQAAGGGLHQRRPPSSGLPPGAFPLAHPGLRQGQAPALARRFSGPLPSVPGPQALAAAGGPGGPQAYLPLQQSHRLSYGRGAGVGMSSSQLSLHSLQARGISPPARIPYRGLPTPSSSASSSSMQGLTAARPDAHMARSGSGSMLLHAVRMPMGPHPSIVPELALGLRPGSVTALAAAESSAAARRRSTGEAPEYLGASAGGRAQGGGRRPAEPRPHQLLLHALTEVGRAERAAQAQRATVQARKARLQGEVFWCLLPVFLVLWACMVAWLGIISLHHYCLLVVVRRDRSWDIRWTVPLPAQLHQAEGLGQQQANGGFLPARLGITGLPEECEEQVAQGDGSSATNPIPPRSPHPCALPADTSHCRIPKADSLGSGQLAYAVVADASSAPISNMGTALATTPQPQHLQVQQGTVDMSTCEGASSDLDSPGPALGLDREAQAAAAAAAVDASAEVPSALLPEPAATFPPATMPHGMQGQSASPTEPAAASKRGWFVLRRVRQGVGLSKKVQAQAQAKPAIQQAHAVGGAASSGVEMSRAALGVLSLLTDRLACLMGPSSRNNSSSNDASNDTSCSAGGTTGCADGKVGSGCVGSDSSSSDSSSTTATGASRGSSREAQLQSDMVVHLNQMDWHKVPVDTMHYHAHAAIVVRSAKRFAESHGHVVEFGLRQMRGLGLHGPGRDSGAMY